MVSEATFLITVESGKAGRPAQAIPCIICAFLNCSLVRSRKVSHTTDWHGSGTATLHISRM
jgi:hypothetical protein